MIRALLALVFAASLVASDPGPAGAEPRGCVSRAEYRSIAEGMTRSRVESIFGTRRSWFWDGGAGGFSRIYQTCDMRHGAVIEYSTLSGRPRFSGNKWWVQAS